MIYLFYSDLGCADENYRLSDFCLARQEYLSSITDNLRFKQSYYVWKLLLFALEKLGVKNPNFTQNNNKWELISGEYRFSLSHSKNIVCVSVTNSNNGVDVERISNKIYKIKKKINKNSDNTLELTQIWTENECKIKENNCKYFKHFQISDIQENEYDVCVGFINNEEQVIINKIEINNL